MVAKRRIRIGTVFSPGLSTGVAITGDRRVLSPAPIGIEKVTKVSMGLVIRLSGLELYVDGVVFVGPINTNLVKRKEYVVVSRVARISIERITRLKLDDKAISMTTSFE